MAFTLPTHGPHWADFCHHFVNVPFHTETPTGVLRVIPSTNCQKRFVFWEQVKM